MKIRVLAVLGAVLLSQSALAVRGTEILLSENYSKAFTRATVLGRANGAVRECGTNEATVNQWQSAVDNHLMGLALGQSEHFSLERSMCNRPYRCPIAKTFSYLVRQMGVSTDSQQPALLTKETKNAVMLDLVEPLVAREQAAYLKSEPACLVVRDLAQAKFASVLDSFLLNGTPRASVYCRNWHFSNSKFIVAPSISRSAFKHLSIAADIFCAKKSVVATASNQAR